MTSAEVTHESKRILGLLPWVIQAMTQLVSSACANLVNDDPRGLNFE